MSMVIELNVRQSNQRWSNQITGWLLSAMAHDLFSSDRFNYFQIITMSKYRQQ